MKKSYSLTRIIVLLLTLISLMMIIQLAGCGDGKNIHEQKITEAQDSAENSQVREQQQSGTITSPTENQTGTPKEKQTTRTGAEDSLIDKQISTEGATSIETEKPVLLSNINCTFTEEDGDKLPAHFSFTLTNIEDKEWVFAPLSYAQREEYRNPIIAVNALQVTNGQLVSACKESRLKPGKKVNCDFDLDDKSNIILKKSLRLGDAGLGSESLNTVSVRTGLHAAEKGYFCTKVSSVSQQ